ncbi:MAG: aminotransferase class V-fold PLP-dependent enzyme [Candidatus Pacebacteria bacterium]|nr:aminotransferase class V-fold PLP-dependent enzyme [Candidatus Paceibacterota bacterium]
MPKKIKTISSALCPNTEPDDVKLIKDILFKQEGKGKDAYQSLEKAFSGLLDRPCFAFNGGRVAFLAILEALGIKEGDEVLVQGLTCAVMVAPILKLKARPVFVDIDQTLNIDPEDLKRKITPKSKAVVIQHTFGWPAEVEELKKIAEQNNLFFIEDCAHSLGAKYQGEYCGKFGDASFFSLGRDKIISSVCGGVASSVNPVIADGIRKFQEGLGYPSRWWTSRQLFNPLLISEFILPFWSSGGGLALNFLQKTKMLLRPVSRSEKQGIMPDWLIKKMPAGLASLAVYQFKKLDRFNEHRKQTADFYLQQLKNTSFVMPFSGPQDSREPVFMKFPVLSQGADPEKILRKARNMNILLGDGWRKTAVVPQDTDLRKIGYERGSCPRAEKAAQTLINLPTHIGIGLEEAQKIVSLLKMF